MPKYYVAGIPFDSENALMHYGVKGMKWDKHIFGPDANTKYINWMDVGKMASSKRPSNFTDTGSGGDKPILSTRSGAKQTTSPSKFQSAVRSVGGALNSGSNFLTGKQARNNLNNAQNAASKAKSELVKNARLYNAGKANLENANQLATSAANKVLEYNPADPNYQVPEEAANEYRKSKQLERAGKLKVGQANTNRDETMKNWLNAQSNLNTAQKETENTLPSVATKAASGAANDVGNWASQAVNDVPNFVTGNQARRDLNNVQNSWNPFGVNNGRIAEAQAEYNRTLPGMVDQAGNWISGAANDVGRFVSNAAGDVGKAATNAWNGVTGAANSIGDWAGNAARDVGNAAGSTMKALENAYGDASKWVVDNAGTVRDAVTGAALGTADWAVQQYKNLFHSALDDKPDGVTDTFWKNYVASGGTREQYERDWR